MNGSRFSLQYYGDMGGEFFSGVEEKKNRNAILSRYDSFEYISLFGTFFINTRDIGR